MALDTTTVRTTPLIPSPVLPHITFSGLNLFFENSPILNKTLQFWKKLAQHCPPNTGVHWCLEVVDLRHTSQPEMCGHQTDSVLSTRSPQNPRWYIGNRAHSIPPASTRSRFEVHFERVYRLCQSELLVSEKQARTLGKPPGT